MGCGASSQKLEEQSTSLAHFQVERILGKGAFGKVKAVVKKTKTDKVRKSFLFLSLMLLIHTHTHTHTNTVGPELERRPLPSSHDGHVRSWQDVGNTLHVVDPHRASSSPDSDARARARVCVCVGTRQTDESQRQRKNEKARPVFGFLIYERDHAT